MRSYIIILILAFLTSCSSCRKNDIPEKDINDIPERGFWISIKDANGENGYCFFENKVFGLDIGIRDTVELYYWLKELQPLAPVYGSDAETFEVCINSDYEPYAKDRNKVYYHDHSVTECFDGEEIGGEIYHGDISIDGADPQTFKYIGDGYAVDKYNMYYEGRTIAWDENLINRLWAKTKAINSCRTEDLINLLDTDMSNTTDDDRISKIVNNKVSAEPLSDVGDYVALINYLRKPNNEKYDDIIGEFLYCTFLKYPLKFAQLDVYIDELSDRDIITVIDRLVFLIGRTFMFVHRNDGYSIEDLEKLFFSVFPAPYKKESSYSVAYHKMRIKTAKQIKRNGQCNQSSM